VSLTRSEMQEQIEEARKNVRKMKKACPYIFPEHARYMRAQWVFEQAKLELATAKAAWKKVGESK
jgi:hypothetical protein